MSGWICSGCRPAALNNLNPNSHSTVVFVSIRRLLVRKPRASSSIPPSCPLLFPGMCVLTSILSLHTSPSSKWTRLPSCEIISGSSACHSHANMRVPHRSLLKRGKKACTECRQQKAGSLRLLPVEPQSDCPAGQMRCLLKSRPAMLPLSEGQGPVLRFGSLQKRA